MKVKLVGTTLFESKEQKIENNESIIEIIFPDLEISSFLFNNPSKSIIPEGTIKFKKEPLKSSTYFRSNNNDENEYILGFGVSGIKGYITKLPKDKEQKRSYNFEINELYIEDTSKESINNK